MLTTEKKKSFKERRENVILYHFSREKKTEGCLIRNKYYPINKILFEFLFFSINFVRIFKPIDYLRLFQNLNL